MPFGISSISEALPYHTFLWWTVLMETQGTPRGFFYQHAANPDILQQFTPEQRCELLSHTLEFAHTHIDTSQDQRAAADICEFALLHAACHPNPTEAVVILNAIEPFIKQHIKQHVLEPQVEGCLLCARANALDRYGQPELAIEDATRGIQMLTGQPTDTGFLAFGYQGRAGARCQLGYFEGALSDFEEAEVILTDFGNHEALANLRLQKAVPLRLLLRFDQALECLDLAEREFRSLPGDGHDAIQGYDIQRGAVSIGIAQVEDARSSVYYDQGRLSEALAAIDKAMPVFEQHKLLYQQASCTRTKALVLIALGHRTRARESLQEATAAFEQCGALRDIAACRGMLGKSYFLDGEATDAEKCYSEAIAMYDQLGLRGKAAVVRLSSAEALNAQGHAKEALSQLDNAQPFLLTKRDIDLARILKGRVLTDQGFYEDALDEFKQIDESSVKSESLWKFHFDYAGPLAALGRTDQALTRLTQARAAFCLAREVAEVDETNLEFIHDGLLLFRAAVQEALNADEYELAFDAVQDGKAGILRARMCAVEEPCPAHIAEHRRVARSALVSWLMHDGPMMLKQEVHRRLQEKHAPVTDQSASEMIRLVAQDETFVSRAKREGWSHLSALEKAWRSRAKPQAESHVHRRRESDLRPRVQETLPGDIGLLDFWWTDGNTLTVFLLTRDDFDIVQIPVSSRELMRLSKVEEDWRAGVYGRPDMLASLHELVWLPLLPRLAGLKGLYIVPHGPLHLVPLHACWDGTDCTISDQFPRGVAYLPSAESLLHVSEPAAVEELQSEILTLANPDHGSEFTLPFAEWEAHEVHKLFPPGHSEMYVGREATRSRLAKWHNAPVLHFSCHTAASRFFASISHVRLHNDVLLAYDIAFDQPNLRPGSLVVLNGCESGSLDLRAVDEAWGLTSAFLLKGAATILANRWFVDDLCAAEFVATFLRRRLVDQVPTGEAFRMAQDRVRSITQQEREERCRELMEQRFLPEEFPYEAARLAMTAMRSCQEVGNAIGARHYADIAASVRQFTDTDDRETRLETSVSRSHSGKQAPAFDHPAHWASFHLVGRLE